jgi:putative ABC transport system permease protein
LARQPAYTAVVAGTLALGIGATTAVFSVLNSVILNPLPYPAPDRLVRMYSAWEDAPDARQYMPVPDFLDIREGVGAFEDVAALYTYRETGLDLDVSGRPTRVRALRISADYFDVYGATPLLGRTFDRSEENSQNALVILSHHLWKGLTDSDPEIVGNTIVMNGVAYVVVGVMRPTFRDVVAGEVDVWIPEELQREYTRGNHFLTLIGRLAPGVTTGQARAELDVFSQDLAARFESHEDQFIQLFPLHEDVVGGTSAAIYVLMGAAGLVLLIACVNVANLFLARSVARQKDLAIRAALGSGRGRLAGQLLTESVTLAVVGGIVGLVVAFAGVKLLLAMSPQSLARSEELSFDPVLLTFAGAVTMITGVLFGLAPAFQATRLDLTGALRDATGGNTGGRGAGRLRGALVTSQVALALMLLIGAGLLIKSFATLQQVDLGFESQNVATFEVHLPSTRYGEPEQRVRFHQELGRRLRALPGVRTAGAISKLPATGFYHSWGYRFTNADGEPDGQQMQVRVVEGDFFAAMGITLLSGRTFSDDDRRERPMVAVINQRAATRAWGNQDPLGRSFRTGGREWTVVGVVEDVAHDYRGGTTPKAYLPHAQFGDDRIWALTQVVATNRGGQGLFELARRELATIDPNLVLHQPRTMENVMAREVARERFSLTLMMAFAGIAVTLAAIGIYGVLSYSVSQRTKEIGIRIALGAPASQVRRIVVGQGMLMATIGIGLGLVGALALSRWLDSMMFGTNVRDPVIFSSVALSLAIVAGVAGYLPARRATRTDPMETLRRE